MGNGESKRVSGTLQHVQKDPDAVFIFDCFLLLMGRNESVGVYSFITPDWKQLGYPLDLWLKHNLKIFDQISLVLYGNVEIPVDNDIIVKEIVEPPEKKQFTFYSLGKTMAQKNLHTDWKVLLDIDEFITSRPILEDLDKSYSYYLRYRNLFGNAFTEIKCVNAFPKKAPRVHYGDRTIEGDGGLVSGPYKKIIVGEFFHTNTIRDPNILSAKWKEQILREMNEGIFRHTGRLEYLNEPFNFSAYKEVWPGSYLVSHKKEELPRIIVENIHRFHDFKFENSYASKSYADKVNEFLCPLRQWKVKYRNVVKKVTK